MKQKIFKLKIIGVKWAKDDKSTSYKQVPIYFIQYLIIINNIFKWNNYSFELYNCKLFLAVYLFVYTPYL